MKICICDDKASELSVLKKICVKYLNDKKVDADLICTQNPIGLLEEDYDLLILDIEMPEMSGIEVKNRLFGRERPLIIFATSYEENMRDAFGPNVIGFMKKPVTMEDFAFYIDQAVRLLMAGKIVELEKGKILSTEQIVMITTDEKYTVAILEDGTVSALMDKSLSVWEKELSDVYFVRASSAYLVNCKHIKEFYGDQITLSNGETLRVSRRKKTACFDQIIEYRRKYQKFA